MKKVKIAMVALCATFFMNTNAVQAQAKDNAIKMNIFGAIIGQYQLSYERAMGEKASLQLSAGYISRDWDVSSGGSDWTQEDRGFIVIPEGRMYFAEGLKGAYAAAFARYRSVTVDYIYEDSSPTESWTRTSVGGGLLLGYQALISDALVIDVAIGPQYKAVSVDGSGSPDFEGESDGVGVRFAFNIGYAF